MRLIEKDEQIHGGSPNAKVFVLVSDGQAWSGEVARSIKLARDRDFPIFVVGVGTVTGGLIPEPVRSNPGGAPLSPSKPIHSSLDRESLGLIAAAGNGQYLELDREGDREIANRIINTARRRAGSAGLESTTRDLYWDFLFAAACLVALGVLFMQERAELWLVTLGTSAALFIVWTVTR
jgi:hypothetical protein